MLMTRAGPAWKAQNGAWCAYYMAARGIAGSQPLSSAWLPCAGLVGTVDPVRIRPRQGHRVDARGAKRLRLPQQLRQLGEIRRNPSRLVARQQFSCRPSPRLILEIDVGKLLTGVVADAPMAWPPPQPSIAERYTATMPTPIFDEHYSGDWWREYELKGRLEVLTGDLVPIQIKVLLEEEEPTEEEEERALDLARKASSAPNTKRSKRRSRISSAWSVTSAAPGRGGSGRSKNSCS
jgi:hypothetical protein